ncbi:DNA primase [Mycobacterium phage MalagasyRose]|uniref:DNA primase n=1 Tax=Mycobacterium phage MalagasyRose TaxID=2599870 RepID=A0A5J6TGE4_9CAUD|nr:DNA primase [Mycobacterium phage MalagasyRose]QFG08917.1 DNA primase [Mycobacterium phage MalagasyRose]
MNFADLLETIAYREDEYLSVCWQRRPGETWHTAVVPAGDAAAYAASKGTDCGVWFGINPTSGPPRENAGRGKDVDVTRFSTLHADLDSKADGCGSEAVARTIIDDLSDLLGVRPSAIVHSGHGLQPYWPIEDAESVTNAGALLKRWGRLVALVADRRGAKVDGVYDLARVMRVPGTMNVKTEPFVMATCEFDTGGPLTVDEVRERLDEAGVPHLDGDGSSLVAHIDLSPPSTWAWAATACHYATTMAAGWAQDNPPDRHPWLVAQATRIAAAHRNGCLTQAQHRDMVQALATRFAELCNRGNDPRPVGPREVEKALGHGERIVAVKSEAQIDTELGRHLHLSQLANGIQVTVRTADTPPPDPGDDYDDYDNGDDDGNAELFTPTDTGNSDLLVRQYGHRLRYCEKAGKWLSWDGARWLFCAADSEAMTAARRTIEGIVAGEDAQLQKHKLRSMSRRGLENAVALARRDPAMIVAVDQLDVEPYELNTPSGIVNLRTGRVVPHNPDRWHTKITGVGYESEGAAPRWWAFLHRTFGGDNELVAYMQRLSGYAATGEVTHHVLPFLFGAGSNGKSVFTDVLTAVLGDYAITAPGNFLLAGREKHETEIARLHGARLVVCSEVNADSKFDEAKVKVLTGGDVLSARFMRQDFFDFIPTHTLFLMGNHQPEVTAGGTSFFRRLRQIPFLHTVPPEERIEGLAQQLVREEGAAILAWVVDGARDVLAAGMREPESVLAATADYQDDTRSGVARFIDECCTVGEGESEVGAVHNCYSRWAMANGEPSYDAARFGRELTALQVPRRRTKRARYCGLKVHTDRLPANGDSGSLFRHHYRHHTDEG